MASNEVVLCGAVRTPIGTYGGALKDLPASELGAAVIRETLLRNGLAGAQVQSLVMGNVIQAGNRMNPARQAGLAAGLPVEVPALTVNRVCGSGAQAVVSAALEVAAGMVDCAVAGGMENMDRAPYLLPQGRWGARMGDVTLFDSMLLDGLHDAVSGQHAGWHTEDLVIRCGVSREDQDRWALRSQLAFSAAQAAGRFDGEIVTLQVPGRKGPVPFARDEHNRPETTMESLARLKPAFRKEGTITAANASQISDGGCALVMMSERAVNARGVAPLGQVVGYGMVAGPDNASLLHQPSRAIHAALARVGKTVGDVDLFEINEAFAAVGIASMSELGITDAIVNVNGGAIALGHPIGMSGNRLALTLLHELRRRGGGLGAAALCGGGGQGDALLVRSL